MDLYPRIVGPAWSTLGTPVRKLHSTAGEARVSGSFTVTHGNNLLARLIVHVLAFPAVGEGVPTVLVVSRLGNGEQWHRTFAGKRLISRQYEHPGPLLRERIGIMDFLFSLEVETGALVYRQTSVSIGVGKLRLPLPVCLAPRIVAAERSKPGDTRVFTSVRIFSPLLGLLIAYEGSVETEGSAG